MEKEELRNSFEELRQNELYEAEVRSFRSLLEKALPKAANLSDVLKILSIEEFQPFLKEITIEEFLSITQKGTSSKSMDRVGSNRLQGTRWSRTAQALLSPWKNRPSESFSKEELLRLLAESHPALGDFRTKFYYSMRRLRDEGLVRMEGARKSAQYSITADGLNALESSTTGAK